MQLHEITSFLCSYNVFVIIRLTVALIKNVMFYSLFCTNSIHLTMYFFIDVFVLLISLH